MFCFQNILHAFKVFMVLFRTLGGMKKLILAAALLLALTGARNPIHVFADPMPECPPLCTDGGN